MPLVTRTRSAALAAYANSDVPFERIVEALNPTRSMGRHPLFQVMVGVEPEPIGLPLLGEAQVTKLPVDAASSKFDLSVSLVERYEDGKPVGLRGGITFRTDLFTRAGAMAIGPRLERLLRAVLDDPSQAIAATDLLSDAERAEALAFGTDTAMPVDAPSTLLVWIAARVQQTPDAIAVIDGDRHVTYAALGAQAQQLAWWLRAQGVGAETVVGVAIDRSTTWVTAVLGVLTAGGAYLPLDPQYPAARLQAMVADAQPLCVASAHAQRRRRSWRRPVRRAAHRSRCSRR